MGVIIGTGTNACYPEKPARILKSPDLTTSDDMIINMEWGGFSKLKMNVYDGILDGASHKAGMQLLEKMVSGMYLGEIARLVIVEMITKGLIFSMAELPVFSGKYTLHSEHLSGMAQGLTFSKNSA